MAMEAKSSSGGSMGPHPRQAILSKFRIRFTATFWVGGQTPNRHRLRTIDTPLPFKFLDRCDNDGLV